MTPEYMTTAYHLISIGSLPKSCLNVPIGKCDGHVRMLLNSMGLLQLETLEEKLVY
jgi:hypothetical protein